MRIILCSDGTGNAASKVWRTNVWRVFESVDLSGNNQVAFYDDGVGTSSFKPLAILGGAFGWGLKRNVIDIYKFLCRNYKSPSDEIFGFGFSRGAFTMRIVAGFALNQGLIPLTTESELDAKAHAAYRAYRAERFHTILGVEKPLRFLRDLFIRYVFPRIRYDKKQNVQLESIRFLGLWDTVAAYGLPVDEMTRGVSRWIWPLELPDHTLSPRVQRACQALSLDDERTTFHPELWDETDEPVLKSIEGKSWTKDERISQVWFAGVHSNVGGGYPDDSLALMPMYWIMKEAQASGLAFKTAPGSEPDTILHVLSARDKDGRLYDSRQGLGGYYRYGPRKLKELCQPSFIPSPRDKVFIDVPKIHESVIKRIEVGAHSYAPIGFPSNYNVVLDNGEIVSLGPNTYENSAQAKEREKRQEFIWNLVWWKRVVYFLTVATTVTLISYPLLIRPGIEGETTSRLRPLSDLIRIAGAFVPNAFDLWVNNYARSPAVFLLLALSVALLIYVGVVLGGTITDRMRRLWIVRGGSGPTVPSNVVYKLRTCSVYQASIRTIKYRIAPVFFAILFLYVGFALTSHIVFNFADAAGFTCTPTASKDLKPIGESPITISFDTSSLCHASGYSVTQGSMYSFKVTTADTWSDNYAKPTVRGYYFGDVEGPWNILRTMLITPLRRNWFRPWHRVLVRTGLTGTEEIFLDPSSRDEYLNVHAEADRVKAEGEIFVYLNDAVIAFPWIADYFYRDNKGKATLTVSFVKR